MCRLDYVVAPPFSKISIWPQKHYSDGVVCIERTVLGITKLVVNGPLPIDTHSLLIGHLQNV